MTWWRFWQTREPVATGEQAGGEPPPARRRGPAASAPAGPSGPTTPPVEPGPPETQRERRRRELLRRRKEAAFDVEQGELALAPDNPWQERITLLSDALAGVETDLQTLAQFERRPPLPLPPTPIRDLRTAGDDQIEVAFTIGDTPFLYREETDWDQRGGPTVRGDLRRQSGDPAALAPDTVPPDRHDALVTHLADSLDVFATDLRDRALAGTPLPDGASLADLAQPCPVCGGWRDWHGRCGECARRDLHRQRLRAEAERFAGERAAEAEARHRLAERLPIARRRLAQIDAELTALGFDHASN